MDMYTRSPDGSLVSMKETSIIESGHSVSNRVRSSVGGETVSELLTGTVLEHCGMRWNCNRVEKLVDGQDQLLTTEVRVMSDINRAEKSLGIDEGSFNVPNLEDIPINPFQAEEGQGYSWQGSGARSLDQQSSSARRLFGEATSDIVLEKAAVAMEKARMTNPRVSMQYPV